MKILDRYILRHFIQHFLFGLFTFIIIFIIVDLFENLDRFIDRNIGVIMVVKYYLFYIPDILKLIIPVGMLLASLFTISRFANYSELTAFKSAGISVYRYLMPIMIFGVIITLFSLYFNGWIVPEANRLKFNFERSYLGKNTIPNVIQNIFIKDAPNRIINVEFYDKIAKKCQNVSIEIFNPDTLRVLKKRYDIREMTWDAQRNEWLLNNITYRIFNNLESENLQFIPASFLSAFADIKNIDINPEVLDKKQLKPEELKLNEFKVYVEKLERSGQPAFKENVDYYSAIAFPFANLVTIIFGVAISSNKRNTSAALHFGISMIVSFLYLGFMKIVQVFGYNGDLPPILAAWLGNLIFLLISITNFIVANKT